jgi:hypothetical protein
MSISFTEQPDEKLDSDFAYYAMDVDLAKAFIEGEHQVSKHFIGHDVDGQQTVKSVDHDPMVQQYWTLSNVYSPESPVTITIDNNTVSLIPKESMSDVIVYITEFNDPNSLLETYTLSSADKNTSGIWTFPVTITANYSIYVGYHAVRR